MKRQKLVVKPDFKALGPRFKSKAKAVGEALKALSAEELKSGTKDDKIKVIVDGETIEIEKDLVTFESVEEEVRGIEDHTPCH